ncbi:hypothetical protein ACHAXA_011766 [Cyclostephanos tholiformis]|uniref:Uncharacterized protein n=1 Tax=Cyclostephanos tholiformis TaxID=382380 RepID=A0ABD3RXQ0_9STRA
MIRASDPTPPPRAFMSHIPLRCLATILTLAMMPSPSLFRGVGDGHSLACATSSGSRRHSRQRPRCGVHHRRRRRRLLSLSSSSSSSSSSSFVSNDRDDVDVTGGETEVAMTTEHHVDRASSSRLLARSSFPPPSSSCLRRWSSSIPSSAPPNEDDATVEARHDQIGRRASLTWMMLSSSCPPILAAMASSFAIVASNPRTASASSGLFRPNPLTNPILERLRVWDQDEADNIVYGGESASPNVPSSILFDTYYVDLLQPILDVERNLDGIRSILDTRTRGGGGRREGGRTSDDVPGALGGVNAILSDSKFDALAFKRAFNAFADNIYYTDPDRANLYLGGGALPGNSQSMAYLLRNEILTNIEDMRAEVTYLEKQARKMGEEGAVDGGGGGGFGGGEGDVDLDELRRLSESANDGMKKYLDLIPPTELKAARAKFASRL